MRQCWWIHVSDDLNHSDIMVWEGRWVGIAGIGFQHGFNVCVERVPQMLKMLKSSERHFDSLCFSQNDRFECCCCPHRWWYKMLVQMGLLNSRAVPSRQIGQAVSKGEDELPHLSVWEIACPCRCVEFAQHCLSSSCTPKMRGERHSFIQYFEGLSLQKTNMEYTLVN